MAEDRLLFQWMGAIHPRFRTPYLAIAAQGIWSSVLVWSATYGTIVSRVIYTEWIFFAALALYAGMDPRHHLLIGAGRRLSASTRP